jgi:hypothetical protein
MAKHNPCWPKGSMTETRDARGRVYSFKRYGPYHVCLYRTGRTRRVGTFDDEVLHVELASPFVAYSVREDSSQGSADVLNRLDLRTGKVDILDYTDAGQMRRFLVTSSGAVVWARYRYTPGLPIGEIRKIDVAGEATLDSGMDIHASSLHLNSSGHRAFWTNAGEERSARLR